MPPDDDSKIIAMYLPRPIPMTNYGNILNSVILRSRYQQAHDWQWIPFDEATWMALNDV